jgi:hypothetical protein
VPKALGRLKTILRRGLDATAALWPEVRVAYGWVHRTAHILHNDTQDTEAAVKRRLHGLLGAMRQHQVKAGALAPAVGHFLKVSRSYWPGLFHCYTVPELPRTNNDLEQFFGAYRYHERRATGRKVASPAVVLRGAVRLVACAATRYVRSRAKNLHLTRSVPGKSYAKHLRPAANNAHSDGGFAGIPLPISPHWRQTFLS